MEARWRRTDKAICTTREVSLRGLPDLLVAEILYGLWARVQEGVKTRPECLRPMYDRMRAQQIKTLEEVTDPAAAGYGREHGMMIRAARTALRRLNTTPEAERVKDVWDMAVFGHPGVLPFTSLVQEPLREAMKVWVYDDLPRRRNKNAVRHARAVISAMALLSESLRLQRPDRGTVPAAWGRSDIVAFCNRMGYLTETGKLSAARRLAFTRFVRRVLLRFRTLGLTGPGQVLAGMPADFALWPEDMPDEPEDTEAGRDLPEEVLRQMCSHLPDLEAMSDVETRVATELLIDTGRRPDEVFTLGYDCLQQDPDGSDVLVYDNHKAYRLGRRLPIGRETATTIRRQQQWVRERFPTTDPARLKLLPRPKTNPEGTKGFKDICAIHRAWVDSLPDFTVPLVTVEADTRVTHLVPFDKKRTFPYAYRHCYAQRHADAGVPVDVLKELMDHRLITTTQGYYRVGAERRREAVDRVTALQFDRHGQCVWRTAKTLLDSEHVRRAIGEVATAYGTCREPSNVAAGGHACPLRSRCASAAWAANTSPPTSPTSPTSRPTSPTCCAAANGSCPPSMPTTGPAPRPCPPKRRSAGCAASSTASRATRRPHPEDRAHIEQAVALVRRSRTVHLGMPRTRQPLPDVRPQGP
ncbi:tyrosine-type recombinase/integrase [Streptomyces sp. NPDC007100]|uniref:tyrosine-type recombinase/integrase n=1 Tax=Streptomyces sp. NPDC007100 TaxID=3155602 RepID=UPI0033F5BDCD